MKARKTVTSLLLVLAMALSGLAVAPSPDSAAKKATISYYAEKTVLHFNSHVPSRSMRDGCTGLESMLDDANAKATYSIAIKNKKIAKCAKNKNPNMEDAHVVYAVKAGTTTGTIYEKLKGKKKTKVGTVKIVVKNIKMGPALDEANTCTSEDFGYETCISPFLGQYKYDLSAMIYKNLMNSPTAKCKFKKSEYSVTYEAEDDCEFDQDGNPIESTRKQIVTVDKKGVVTQVQPGETTVNFTVKFSDNSKYDGYMRTKVLETVLKKEGKYNIDNIRDNIVGINTPVTVLDANGVSGQAAQICFDNAATTPAFKAVEDEVHDKLEMYGSIGRGYSEKSNYSTDLYVATRDRILDFLGADRGTYTCFYTNSTTDGLNKLASALITSKNDLVLTTRIEHHANDLSWRERCKVDWAEVNVNSDFRVNYKNIEKKLKQHKGKVKIVSVSAASNVTGYVQDIHKVAKMAHKYGALLVADGAQIVAHRQFKMIGDPEDPDDDVDFIAFSAHKMYSPYGGGAVVGLKKVLYKHQPTFYGGGTVKFVGDDWVHYKENDVALYEAGSPNYPGVVGLGKAIDVLNDVGFDAIAAHEKVLNRRFIDGLKKFDPNVIIYGDSENIDDRVGVITFNFKDINTQLLAEELSRYGGVATRRGDFCAHPYVWRLMGIDEATLDGYEGCADQKAPGLLRVSFGIYNTVEEVDKFMEILPLAAEKAKERGKKEDNVPEF